MLEVDSDHWRRLIEDTVKTGASGFIQARFATDFVLALKDKGVGIRNVEGCVLTGNFDVLQDDLVLRYDKRLHKEHQPEVSVIDASAEFFIKCIEKANPREGLHFKFFI